MPPRPRPALSTAKARKTLVEKRILRSLESWLERLTDVKRVLKQDDSLDLRAKKRRYMEIMNDRPRKRMHLLKVARNAFEIAGVHATFKAMPEEEVSFLNVEGEPFCNSRKKPGKKGKGGEDDDEDSDSEDEEKEDDADSEDDATAAQEGQDGEDGHKAKRARVEKVAGEDMTSDSENDDENELRRAVFIPKKYQASNIEESAYLTANLDPTLTAEEQMEQQAILTAMEREQGDLINEINALLADGGDVPAIANLAPRLQKLQSSLHAMRSERHRLLQKLYYRSKVEKKLSETIMQLKVELHETRSGRIDWTQKEPVLFNKSITPAFESFYQEHPLTTQHVRNIANSVLVAISQCIGSYRLPKVRADSKIKGSRRERLLSKLRHGLTDALSILERSDPSMFAAFTHRLHNAAAAAAAAAAANGGLPLPLGIGGEGDVNGGGIMGMGGEMTGGLPVSMDVSGGLMVGDSNNNNNANNNVNNNNSSSGNGLVDPLNLAGRGGVRARPPQRGPNPLMLSAMEAATVGSATMPAAEASLLVGANSDAARRGRRAAAAAATTSSTSSAAPAAGSAVAGRAGGARGSGREGNNGVNAASLPVDGSSNLTSHYFMNDPMMAMANAAQQAQRSNYHMMAAEDDSEDDN